MWLCGMKNLLHGFLELRLSHWFCNCLYLGNRLISFRRRPPHPFSNQSMWMPSDALWKILENKRDTSFNQTYEQGEIKLHGYSCKLPQIENKHFAEQPALHINPKWLISRESYMNALIYSLSLYRLYYFLFFHGHLHKAYIIVWGGVYV